VVAVLLGAAACYGVLAITEPPGPGLDPDTMSYLGAAESLVHHGSLRIPSAHWLSDDSTEALGHFPPGYPLIIAVPVALGAPAVQAARGIEAAAAFVTVALAVWLVGAVAGTAAGALAGVLLLVSPSFAFDHWQIISEPLCLALLLATLALVTRSSKPWTYGLTAAAAGIVRYAAVASTGAVALWAFGLGGTRRARLHRAVVAAAPSVIVQTAWTIRSALEGGEVRKFGLRGNLAATFHELAGTLGGWLAPAVPRPSLQAALALAVAALGGLLLVSQATARPAEAEAGASAPVRRRMLAAAALLASCYAAFVIFSRLFVDETIPFDVRILSPFIVLVEVAVAAALGGAAPGWGAPARAAAGVAVLAWLAASAVATAGAVRDALDGGWGYASDDWRASRLAEWLRTEAGTRAIFSNNTATAWFLTHRPSRDVPQTLAADSLAEFGRALRARHGVLVRFPFDLEEGVAPDSLAKRLGLIEMARFPDGAVWGPPRAGPSRRPPPR